MDSKLEKITNKWLWDPQKIDPLEREDKICAAIFNVQMDIIVKIIKAKGINFKTIFNLTLLHLACKYEKLELVKYLIGKGANVHLKDINERTPIFYTVHHTNMDIVRELKLDQKSFDYRDKYGVPAFYYTKTLSQLYLNYLVQNFKYSYGLSLHNRFTESRDYFDKFMIKLLKRNSGDSELMTVDDNQLIIYAMETNNLQFLTDVVKDFIDVKAIDSDECTILHKIYMNYNPQWSWKLIHHVVDLFQLKGANINAITKDGLSLTKIIIDNNMPIELLKDLSKQFSYTWSVDNLNRTDLHYSIINQKSDYFEWLIKNWPQFNRIDIDGNTCLHLTILYTNDIEYEENDDWKLSCIIKILEGCDYNLLFTINNDGKTALDLARDESKANMYQLLEELMIQGPVQSTIIDSKTTPLRIFELYFLSTFLQDGTDSDNLAKLKNSIISGDRNEIEKLINIRKNLLIEKDNNDCTCLHFACSNYKKDIIELLLQNGARLNDKDKNGRIPLHYAIQSNDLEIIKILVDDTNIMDCLKRDIYGHSPLTFSCYYSDKIFNYFYNKLEELLGDGTLYILRKLSELFVNEYKIYNKFMKYSRNENIITTIDLMRAICNFNDKLFLKLYTRICLTFDQTNINANKLGTPLQQAVKIYHWNYHECWLLLARILIEYGDNVHIKTEINSSLLHLAAANKNTEELYKFLLAYLIDINSIDDNGKTAIHLLLEQGNIYGLDILYNQADLKQIDRNGDNYLHYSIKFIPDGLQYNHDGVRMVFKKELLQKNKDGKTPLHLTCEYGKTKMFDSLLAISTENPFFNCDNFGKTPLDYAAEKNHYNIIWNGILNATPKTDSKFIDLYFGDGIKNRAFSNIISTGNEKFLENQNTSIGQEYHQLTLLKLCEEFSITRVQLENELEFNIQKAILDSDLFVKERGNVTEQPIKQSEYVKQVRESAQFLINIIKETLMKMNDDGGGVGGSGSGSGSDDDIDIELYQKIMEISINIRHLKIKLYRFIRLPWREMEFILISYLTIFTKQTQIDTNICKILLNKQKIRKHLKKFCIGLEGSMKKISISGLFPTKTTTFDGIFTALSYESQYLTKLVEQFKKNQSSKCLDIIRSKIYELKDLIDSPVQSEKLMKNDLNENIKSMEFKELNDDYDIIRTFYSLTKILRYVNESVIIDIKSNELGILVIQRTMQVFTEYIKNSPDSTNVSQKIHNAILLRTKYLKDCLTKVRSSGNDLQYSDYMKSTFDLETNTDLFLNIQNDLRYLRTFLINLMYEEREDCIRKLLKKMFDCKTTIGLDDLCNNFSKRIGLPDYDPYLKIQILIQKLKEILVYKTNDEENLFSKIDNILLSRHNESTLDYNFGNPETFLLSTADEVNLSQTKEFLRINDGPKKGHEPFQLIIYFILQLQRLTESRLFPNQQDDFEKIDNCCIEILWTSLLSVKEKLTNKITYQNHNEFQVVLTKDINNSLDDFVGRINNVNVRSSFEIELKRNLRIHRIFNRIKELVQITNKTDREADELDTILTKYKTLIGKENTSSKWKINLEFVKTKQNEEDQYFRLLENCFREKSVTLPLQKFLNSFKCLKDNKRNELRKCFMARINKLRELIPDIEVGMKYTKPKPSLSMAVEVIVLNLFELLEELQMLETNREFLDAVSLPISAKTLRNYLIQGDVLFDLLPFNMEISIFSNGLKLINFIKDTKLKINSDDHVICYSRVTNNGLSTAAERYRLKMDFIRQQNNILGEAIKCNPLGSVCYFYKIPILRGVDLKGRTLFNLIFENNPIKTIEFFINNKMAIRSQASIRSLTKQLNLTNINNNLMNIDSLCQYLVNQLFVVNKRQEIVTLLIQISALHGFHKKIDEICSLSGDEDMLKKNYNILMNFSDKYTFITNVQRYSRACIPDYEIEYSLLHLSAAFNHINVVKRILSFGTHVDVKARNKKTALHVAAQCNYIGMIELLKMNKANVQAKTIDGLTYMDYLETKSSIINDDNNIQQKSRRESI